MHVSGDIAIMFSTLLQCYMIMLGIIIFCYVNCHVHGLVSMVLSCIIVLI